MWGLICLLWMFTWTIGSCAPSTSTVCPENCECTTVKDGLKAHCSSWEFLSKLRPKQIQEITDLDLSGLHLKTVDNKLRKLKNLKKLNLSKNKIDDLNNFPNIPHLTHLYLSHNNIKQFTASDLPKSVRHLDLSSNRISNITDISPLLPHLSEINLNDNILSCECDFLKYRDALNANNVHIVRSASCYTPETVRGISLLSVYCVSGTVTYDMDFMLRDEPGSGEDVSGIVPVSTSLNVFDFSANEGDNSTEDDEIEDGYIRASDSNSSSIESAESNLEGSGSVGYDIMTGASGEGEIIFPDPAVPHCFYNCSTPAPDRDANSSAPRANISQEFSRMFDEITNKKTDTTTTTTTTQTPVHETVQEKSAATQSETVSKEAPTETSKTRINASNSIDVPKESQVTEDKKNNKTTYIVVAVLFLAMLALIVYVVVKKRKNRNSNNRRPASNHEVKEPAPVEMKPLMSETPPPIKTNNTLPERAPLMNGQNGTSKKQEDDDQPNDEVDGKAPEIAPALVQNGIDAPDVEEPQMRPKQEDDALLTPGTKRVTIQAKELSSPKSPVLVHRHLGDDGNMVSSPISNNEFKYT